MKTYIAVIAVPAFWLASTLQAACADYQSWQMASLFEPSTAQISHERKGRVMIYHGLKDTDVDRAMNEQFERIETMMFTGTILTDDAGRPLRDPETGAFIVEDDGC